MRNDYKEVFLSIWAIYEYLGNSFAGQYFKVGYDVNYHENPKGPQKEPPNISFRRLSEKLSPWPTNFIACLEP